MWRCWLSTSDKKGNYQRRLNHETKSKTTNRNSKTTLRIQEGTIDSSYRGEVKIIAEIRAMSYDGTESLICQTMPTRPFTIEKGMKIAQLIIQPVPQFEIVEAGELSESDRGESGFGSTGV